MPEGYTHVRTGRTALLQSGVSVLNLDVFGAGAQGPDPLFFYKIWSKHRKPDLYAFAGQMHKKQTGRFLASLVKNAKTQTQRDYSLGFLTHYATDKNAHPYVSFLTDEKNAPYSMPNGHGLYEIGLDSALYELDYGTSLVPLSWSTPMPKGEALNEITSLLSRTIYETYSEKIDAALLAKSFSHMKNIRKWLRSPRGFMRKLYTFAEQKILKSENYLNAHITPAKHPQSIPDFWYNPFENRKKYSGGIDEILKTAIKEGAEYIKAADNYWKSRTTLDGFRQVIGNKSYESNLESI